MPVNGGLQLSKSGRRDADEIIVNSGTEHKIEAVLSFKTLFCNFNLNTHHTHEAKCI